MIGDGTAQRSRVTSLTVNFSEVISYVGLPTAAFTLERTVGGVPTGTVSFTVSTTILAGHSVATINFTSDTAFGSLTDGHYRLTVIAGQVRDTAGNFIAGNVVQDFHRFFGDANGDDRITKSLLRKSSDKHVAKSHECDGHRQCGNQKDQCFVSARAACPPVHIQSEEREQAKGSCDNPPSGPRKEQASHDHDSERKRQGQPGSLLLRSRWRSSTAKAVHFAPIHVDRAARFLRRTRSNRSPQM